MLLGFQIAVHDVLVVSAIQHIRDLPTQVRDLVCFLRTLRQSILKTDQYLRVLTLPVVGCT